jgi:hypothetical protein
LPSAPNFRDATSPCKSFRAQALICILSIKINIRRRSPQTWRSRTTLLPIYPPINSPEEGIDRLNT